jgi:hypothetical protein
MNKGNKTFNQLPLVLFFIFYNKCFYKPNTSVNKHSRKSSDQKLLKMTAEQPKDQQQPNKKITNTAEAASSTSQPDENYSQSSQSSI